MIAWVSAAAAGTWDEVRALRSDEAVVAPTLAQREAWLALVSELGRAAPSGAVPVGLSERARALGFVLETTEGRATLSDAPGQLRGAGWYSVRLGRLDGELVLQAPHPFFDLRTGELAAKLADDRRVRAVFVATADRDAAEGADPAHAPESWFQGATQALAEVLPSPSFVQLHGFGAGRTEACAVVSEGATHLDRAALERVIVRLTPAFGCDDVRTGEQVPALAARTNVQGHLLSDRALFLHLELARAVRDRLVDEAGPREDLVRTLVALAREGR